MKKLALLVILVASGCSTPLSQLRKELGPRAAENMDCPEEKLDFEELQRLVATTRVKVKGCGKATVWYLEESRWKKDQAASQ